MAFELHQTLAAGEGTIEEILGVASTQYAVGEMLAVVAGLGTKAVAASKGTHVVVGMKTPETTNRQDSPLLTTTAGEKLHCMKVEGGKVVLKSPLTGNMAPPVNGVTCNTNSTANLVKFDHASADGAFDTGTCYCPELNEQRLITDDTKVSSTHTFTVVPAFTRAVTSTDTIIAVAFSKGMTAVKFDATTPALGVSTAVGDITGGNVKIHGVDLEKLEVYTVHPDQE